MILKSITIERILKPSLYDIVKIIIISMVAFYLIGGYSAYFETARADAYLYAVTTIDLFNGSFGFTNDLLQEEGSWDFVPYMWTKTNQNTAIPIGDVGIYAFTSFFYLVGGLYGLFYLGPILTIIFFVIAERIATNLFGKFVGLLTLVFLASDFILLWIGIQLRNDNIFTIFFILGCFYLIKFFKDKKDTSILLCSIFFTAGTFIRLNGIIAFPLEILLVLGYFGFHAYSQRKNESKNPLIFMKNIFSKLRKKDFIKKTFLLFIPWIIFLGFFVSFNNYYFGDPFTNYFGERPSTLDYETDSIMSFFKFDSWRFTWINFYSVGFLPDILKDFIFNSIPTIGDNLGGNPIGLVSFSILLITLIMSLYYKKKRTEVVVFSIFILGIVLFYSSGFLHATNLNAEEYQPTLFSRDRYMIPALPLYLMIFSFFIYLTWEIFLKKILYSKRKASFKTSKYVVLVLVSIVLGITLFYSTPVQGAWDKGIKVNNPYWDTLRFPLDMEGFSEEDSIILEGRRYAYEYDAIHFFPYWGYWDKLRYEFDWDSIPQEPIERLKQLMDEGYNVYTFKEKYKWEVDGKYFRYLESEHGLILTGFSTTFCKLERINDINYTAVINSESFKSCNVLGSSLNEISESGTVIFVDRFRMFYDEESEQFVKKRITLTPSLKSLMR